jgi:hypothetical protein
MPDRPIPPGLASFWEEADLEAAADHPLARELAYQVDALSRCARLLEDARAAADEEVVRDLRAMHERQEQLVNSLTSALRASPRAGADGEQGA